MKVLTDVVKAIPDFIHRSETNNALPHFSGIYTFRGVCSHIMCLIMNLRLVTLLFNVKP